MKGKLYELRAEVVMYYWSEHVANCLAPSKRRADQCAAAEIGEASFDADVALTSTTHHTCRKGGVSTHWSTATTMATSCTASQWAHALDAMAAQREKAAFDARQERLL
jgi:hypothetical protein